VSNPTSRRRRSVLRDVSDGPAKGVKRAVVAKMLRSIASANDGMITPQSVVEAARPASSPIHECFQWDNTKAAHEYRLFQARQLIRVTVEVIPSMGDKTPMRVYVSIGDDRGEGGYRRIVDVMNTPELRDKLLSEAKRDMQVFRTKYAKLVELSKVFGEMDKVA
jgi:hypothetical protein